MIGTPTFSCSACTPGSRPHSPLLLPSTPGSPVPLMSCPLRVPLPLPAFCLNFCHGLLACLPTPALTPSAFEPGWPCSTLSQTRPQWLPFLRGQGRGLTEAFMASCCPLPSSLPSCFLPLKVMNRVPLCSLEGPGPCRRQDANWLSWWVKTVKPLGSGRRLSLFISF